MPGKKRAPVPATVSVFSSPGSWIESAAIDQCHHVAAPDGMTHVAARPDLHPGKGAPIGAAMASTVLYPYLVGSDIGAAPAGRCPAPTRCAGARPSYTSGPPPAPDGPDPIRPAAGRRGRIRWARFGRPRPAR
ncbi:RtcB family protein [Micromonospora sp. NPDC050980]|uniref:RtcB family protein n=1 Tax=Micromonospora sp. NPDC050980 TaxID=3155161 RepID=UPI0033E6B71C